MKFAIFTRDERFVFVEMDANLVDSFRAKYSKACEWRLINIDECKTKVEAIRKAKKQVKEARNQWGQDITPQARASQVCRLSTSDKYYYGLLRKFRSWRAKEHKPQICWYLKGRIDMSKTAADYGCSLGF